MAGLSARIDTSGSGFNDSNFNDPLQVPCSALKSGKKVQIRKANTIFLKGAKIKVFLKFSRK